MNRPGAVVRRVAAASGWSALATAAALGLAVAGDDETSTPLVLAATLAAWALPLNLAGLGLLAVTGRRRGALVALVAVAATLVGLRPFPHGGARVDSPGAVRLTVAGQNLEHGHADAARLVAALRAGGVDVVVLTELTSDAVDALHRAGLDTLMPHRVIHPMASWNAGGTGVWSRHPVSDSVIRTDTEFATVITRVRVGAREVTVLGVHPPPPQHAAWRADLATITTEVARRRAGGETVVLAGDFNGSTALGPIRRLLATGLVDAAATRQWAWQQPTWPQEGIAGVRLTTLSPPVLRLDHVLVPAGSQVDRYGTFSVPGTDHRGVVATVTLR